MLQWLHNLLKPPENQRSGRRNAFCSFCRHSFRDVGPLVEGPGDVFICEKCAELSRSIIAQERTTSIQRKRYSPISR
jgi:hypothetical protein